MMESPEETRAKEFVAKAEKALKGGGWGWFSSSSAKYDDAFELYTKAANNFKIAKKWEEAGNCFELCAKMKTNTNHQFDAASSYILAAEMFQRVDMSMALQRYNTGISLFAEIGKFGRAARAAETVANAYEKDNDLENALSMFQQASDYFSGDNANSKASGMLEKVAFHAASLEQYDKALKLFEKLGTESLECNLRKYSAKNHFLHACLCALAKNDMVAAQNALDRFNELDFSFAESRESKLIAELIECCQEFDVDRYADVLYSFDSVKKLTPWETSMFCA